jgi:hypothetical protein
LPGVWPGVSNRWTTSSRSWVPRADSPDKLEWVRERPLSDPRGVVRRGHARAGRYERV